MTEEVQIKAFPGIYGSNCYLVSQNKIGFIVDAGPNDSSIVQYLLDNDIKIINIFCTHSHIDHVLFAMDLKELTGAKIALHSDDVNHYKYYTKERMEGWIKSGELTQDQMPYINKFIGIRYDTLLGGGEIFHISDMKIKIVYTPGHSKGSICLLVNGKYLFTGDTIYDDNVGNTDIDSGNYDDIIKSIKEKILPLDGSVIIFQGHGASKMLKDLKLIL